MQRTVPRVKGTELERFVTDVVNEVRRAVRHHGSFHSLHEAYAVILEEVDELWDLVRLKSDERDPADVRAELMQIAASAIKAAKDLDLLEPQPAAADEE